jgi:hypothetical protein
MQYSRLGLPLDAGDPSRVVAAGVTFHRVSLRLSLDDLDVNKTPHADSRETRMCRQKRSGLQGMSAQAPLDMRDAAILAAMLASTLPVMRHPAGCSWILNKQGVHRAPGLRRAG